MSKIVDNTFSVILINKMNMMITNRLSRTPRVPMMTKTTFSARSRMFRRFEASSSKEDVVVLFQTSLGSDEFSIAAERCLICPSLVSLFYSIDYSLLPQPGRDSSAPGKHVKLCPHKRKLHR